MEGIGAEEEGLGFAEGVGDFGDGGERSAVGGGDEVEGDGIELVAEHARKGEQEDTRVGGGLDAAGGEVGEDAGFEGGAGAGGRKEGNGRR